MFYGRENLRKYGLGDLANLLDKMIAERPWIADYGMTEQKKMTNIMKSASIWLHPTEFIESFCITALETQLLGIYAITRRWGGLGDTLADGEKNGFVTLFEDGPYTKEAQQVWADEVLSVIKEKRWEKIKVEPAQYAWSEVAREWISEFRL